jgi:cell cycle checkpoint protein
VILAQNAVMSISEAGFAVTVEEVKTLCGEYYTLIRAPLSLRSYCPLHFVLAYSLRFLAIAWIPTNLFSEFTFNEPTDTPACFELSLDGLLQCLNIFGNASTGAASGPVIRNRPRWAGDGNEDDAQSGQGGNKRGAGRTNMRMIWQGTGWPLSILL